ncbi:DinB family protein [Roseimaritima ulvae]|uniref:DinB superfamily protein n=1 Tax=Roseimaritima ulvae TaxID=980254 RepID=A0A5B9QX08_9BACT|nr:DinB family protein [Roseimaritima ulvae]QEG42419.1 DinB superfamily protein [Roseimaritima ulvae]
MNAQDVIRQTAGTSMMVVNAYLSDLDDSELCSRPGPGCNPIAWQLGHLISSECRLLDSICPGSAATLPDGFDEQHSKDNANKDQPGDFCSKQEYLDLFTRVHAASMAALEQLSEADLDAPAPEHMREMFPTVGAMFVLIATHPMMHVGQWVPARRALGKPVVI